MKKILLIMMIVLLIAGNGHATVYYIRSGQAGNGSAWDNALDDIPDPLAREDVVWVADGTYDGRIFDEAEDGTKYITINKATVASHGDGTGWDNAYGDGQSVFQAASAPYAGVVSFYSDYWIFNGQVGRVDNSVVTPHGFKVTFTGVAGDIIDGSNILALRRGADNVTISHTEVDGLTQGADGTLVARTDGFYCVNITGGDPDGENNAFSYCYAHDVTRTGFYISEQSELTIEHCYITRLIGGYYKAESPELYIHNEAIVVRDCGLDTNNHFRFNVFHNTSGTGVIVIEDAIQSGMYIHGNVGYNTSVDYQLTNGIIANGSGDTNTKMYIYNNVWYGYPDPMQLITFYNGSDNHVYNNVFIECNDRVDMSGVDNRDNNAFEAVTADEDSEVVITSPSFVDAVNGDFRLVKNSQLENKGTMTLEARPDSAIVDPDGNTYDTPPSIGAYEYTAAGSGGATTYFIETDGDDAHGGTNNTDDAVLSIWRLIQLMTSTADIGTFGGGTFNLDEAIVAVADTQRFVGNDTILRNKRLIGGGDSPKGFAGSGGADADSAEVNHADHDGYETDADAWLSTAGSAPASYIQAGRIGDNVMSIYARLQNKVPYDATVTDAWLKARCVYGRSTVVGMYVTAQDSSNAAPITTIQAWNQSSIDTTSTSTLWTPGGGTVEAGVEYIISVTDQVQEVIDTNNGTWATENYMNFFLNGTPSANYDYLRVRPYEASADSQQIMLSVYWTTGGGSADSLYWVELIGENATQAYSTNKGVLTMVAMADLDSVSEAHIGTDTLYVYGLVDTTGVYVNDIDHLFDNNAKTAVTFEEIAINGAASHALYLDGAGTIIQHVTTDSLSKFAHIREDSTQVRDVIIDVSDSTFTIVGTPKFNYMNYNLWVQDKPSSVGSNFAAWQDSSGANAYGVNSLQDTPLYNTDEWDYALFSYSPGIGQGIEINGFDEIGAWEYATPILYIWEIINKGTPHKLINVGAPFKIVGP